MRLAWLGALRYLSFFQYGYEALVANEMAGQERGREGGREGRKKGERRRKRAR
jgi:hypothetical protein